MKGPKSITIQTWWKPGGGMMYNRECLPPDHPEHIYNYVKREFGVDPEDYGIEKPPMIERCPNCGFIISDGEHRTLKDRKHESDDEWRG